MTYDAAFVLSSGIKKLGDDLIVAAAIRAGWFPRQIEEFMKSRSLTVTGDDHATP